MLETRKPLITSLEGGDSLFSGLDSVVLDFMKERSIPGGSLSVARDGKLIYAKGFTLKLDPPGPIQPTSLFRIASVSKPLTATAIVQLFEKGLLKPDDKAYEILNIKAPHVETGKPDPRHATVLHLLQHQGGWDRGVSFDPHCIDRHVAGQLCRTLPITREDLVEWVTRQPLDFEPGTRYAYSNYGYQLLGHIIEKVTGQRYNAYVQEHVLKPLGITRLRQGFTLREKRAEGEVYYHSSNPNYYDNVMVESNEHGVPFPYGGYNLENMVSSGGWIASTVELVQFASYMRNPDGNPVLSSQWTDFMFAPPVANVWQSGSYYACGWVVEPRASGFRSSHGGCLQGVTASLKSREDGLTWCALFNRREETTPFRWDIDAEVDGVLDGQP